MGRGSRVIDRGKRSVVGVNINVIDQEATVARVLEFARAGKPCSVAALAVHGVMTGATDPHHCYRLNALDLVVPDGQPVRWALRLLHKERLPNRVSGPDLMLKVCEMAAREGLSIYLYGSRQKVLDRMSCNLAMQFPNLSIAGSSQSQFRQVTNDENAIILDTIRESGAKIVFVGLGCPRQEVWAFENTQSLSLPVLTVGAAFDFHAGLLPRAPNWMQDFGLEWLFRLAKEPARLWRRYLIYNPWYCWMLARQLLLPARNQRTRQSKPSSRANYA